jgi:abnormal spindle-like microcephaly-associated protein
MKRKFIDIWLQTYEPNALRAALETVTGRVIPATKISSSNFNTSTDGASSQKERTLTRRLEKFLDAFLVQNQDMDRNSSEFRTNDRETLAAVYRRTVHRSILLVILLDKARECSETSFSRCLFLSSSPYKSSLAVLQALTRFLLPSCGDVGKAVAQIDCQLTYEQHPLKEYEYEISNLAVDLRDGVRLTRVVELLLYPSTSLDDCQWPLSRQLKFPCLGRAVKVFNVKTALDGLTSTHEGRQLVSNIRAADIVDGHREKTIALLWGLVSNWGLSGLVDMGDLREEISQLRKRAILPKEPGSPEATDEHFESEDPPVLLKQWAYLVTQLRGLSPENLTANLVDGTVYECILDEYERYILASSQDSASTESKTSLEDRLRMLGCSTQFSESDPCTRTNHS